MSPRCVLPLQYIMFKLILRNQFWFENLEARVRSYCCPIVVNYFESTGMIKSLKKND